MSVSYSLDQEIMPLPGTGREIWGHQTSHYERVIIKVCLLGNRKVLVRLHVSRLGFVPPILERYTMGPLGNQYHTPFANT
jgi:hypothetical protein